MTWYSLSTPRTMTRWPRSRSHSVRVATSALPHSRRSTRPNIGRSSGRWAKCERQFSIGRATTVVDALTNPNNLPGGGAELCSAAIRVRQAGRVGRRPPLRRRQLGRAARCMVQFRLHIDQAPEKGADLDTLRPLRRAQDGGNEATVGVEDDDRLEAVVVIVGVEQAQLLAAVHRIEGVVNV